LGLTETMRADISFSQAAFALTLSRRALGPPLFGPQTEASKRMQSEKDKIGFFAGVDEELLAEKRCSVGV
jgi:hypothetical protein